jgi:hypothetical protein
MSNQNPLPLPEELGLSPAEDEVQTTEVDGEPVVDVDANADEVDSAEADRLAAENGDDADADA